jgi:uridine phosphorylase
MNNNSIPESELVLNKDGSVYHLHLKDEHIADNVIVVGDQGRVEVISKYFDKIECRISNREFVTHTGTFKGKRITALSTGIGTDNIDIVVNELDAAVNIDPVERMIKSNKRKLNIVRIGTSGALQPDIPVGSNVVSEFGLGLDGLVFYYNYNFNSTERELMERVNHHLEWSEDLSTPYITEGSKKLLSTVGEGMIKGITATASGFYGPQGRRLSLVPKDANMNSRMTSFAFKDHRITNWEMETSALYGLGNMLGHNCVTCCLIIANRIRKEFSDGHGEHIKKLIETVLERMW